MAVSIPLPKYTEHNGIYFPPFTTTEWLTEISTQFQPRDTDIFLATYPRSGTTWLQLILHLLKTKKPLEMEIYNYSPFFEMPICSSIEEREKRFPERTYLIMNEVDAIPPPRVFKTHLPYPMVPNNPKTKYIYCLRNPKDCLVSIYHHTCGKALFNYNGPFDHFFDLFIAGSVEYGSWFDHVLGWWSHREDSNLFILSYEELHRNFRLTVTKLAEFVGLPMSEELFAQIEKETSLHAMKSNEFVSLNKAIKPGGKEDHAHIRKGIIGDWRSVLTPEQDKKLDAMIADRITPSLRELLIFT